MRVQAKALVQGYRGRPVLDGFSLDLDGGVTGILGPNGAGKSTLLQTLSTARRPLGGTLKILGRDVADRGNLRGIRQRLGVLPQVFGYFPHFTVREFVTYCAWLREVPAPERPAQVEKALHEVELSDVAGRRMRELSGGMLRRVGIAQALVNEPEVLILDEPTVGLDPEQRVAFRALVRAVGHRSLVVIATQLVEDVAAACDDVVVLFDGAVAFHGSPNDLQVAGVGHDDLGDTPVERGYATVIRAARGAA